MSTDCQRLQLKTMPPSHNALLVYGGYTPETTCLTALDLKEVATRIKNIRST